MRTVFGSTTRSMVCALSLFITSFFLVSAAGAYDAYANSKYAGIVIDAKTGKTLYAHKADQLRYPASLTKMMTLYMLFDAIENGKVRKSTRMRISKHAASMQPSKLGIKAGGSISAEQAIYALVTKSANDVAVAIAEHIGGSEPKFARKMTAKARFLGMSKTTFKNASGLPNSKQVTTARDMARLGVALREHFPKQYKYFRTRYFKYGKRKYGNHNRLLGKVRGVDGIKTGYTRASGFNLVSSVQDRNRSIVGVVMGGRSGKSRNSQMTILIGKYLRKASTGRDRIIVAKQRPKSVFASVLKSTKVPVPTTRPNLVTAYADTNDNDKIIDGDVTFVQSRMNAMKMGQIPVPVQSLVNKTDPVVTATVDPIANVTKSEKIANDSNIPVSGWQIQIGAVPTKQNALDRLNAARLIAPKTLINVNNHTIQIIKNGVTLHRARFAGFSSKQVAWDACAQLKKKFGCLALAN